ncbi:MAG: O-antigen ligase family protein [Flectobacillus sp.]|uniref:O-antigen ligase family protein n=1 Tax=Flectobacillus sp. TaxID=50419 RepID=UPI003B9C2437
MKLFDFKYSRQSIGIFLVFMGSPLIFFFKETLGFGGSSAFTLLSFCLGFVLMISMDTFRRFYKLNVPIFRLGVIFTLVSLIYFYAYNDVYTDSYIVGRDIANYMLIAVFFFMLISVSNEVKEYFLPVTVALTFLGSICLIYSMATNPYFVLGQRATVVFGDGTTATSGNPHVYARNAFAGIFASYFMLQTRNSLWKLFCILNLLISLAVLVMAQVRTIYLAFFIAVALYFYFNSSLSSIRKAIRGFFSPRNIFILCLLLAGVVYFFATHQQLIEILLNYYSSSSTALTKAVLTAIGMADEKTLDYSALGRVGNFEYFKSILYSEPHSLILGKGYRFWYMDMPIVEAFLDYGIIGLWSFGLMNLLILKESLKAMRERNNPFVMFLGYFYITYFLGLFTGGRPNDTPYWFVFAVMIRFVGVKYLDLIPKMGSNTDKHDLSSPSTTA